MHCMNFEEDLLWLAEIDYPSFAGTIDIFMEDCFGMPWLLNWEHMLSRYLLLSVTTMHSLISFLTYTQSTLLSCCVFLQSRCHAYPICTIAC